MTAMPLKDDASQGLTAPFPDSYWVRPGFIAGRYPWSANGDISTLLSAHVTLFLDLTEEGELDLYTPLLPVSVRHLRMPIGDFTVPTPDRMKEILNALDSALAGGRNVYLHCRGGLGRTGTVVGCFLVRHGMTGDQALAEIRRLRDSCGCDSSSPETEAQRSMVRGWNPRS